MDAKIECLVCHKKYTNMATHLMMVHKLSKKDYQLKFPGAKVVSDTFREWQKNRMTKLNQGALIRILL